MTWGTLLKAEDCGESAVVMARAADGEWECGGDGAAQSSQRAASVRGDLSEPRPIRPGERAPPRSGFAWIHAQGEVS
ncbi:hypothetical protein LEN_4383 [Lysobacter enzymogenes]|uniref:Uncharacterized protein n=1 Tax=Lysobacter enzymogenes TaxID=69 RepID=A0AAU9ALP9_LYSEN|nr:hypothetical protein LEN_4383 [Lysobacter enzymogenes]